MKAARKNPIAAPGLGARIGVHYAGWAVLLSAGTLSLGLLAGPSEATLALSQATSVLVVLGMLYRWVRQGHPQPAYVRVRA